MPFLCKRRSTSTCLGSHSGNSIKMDPSPVLLGRVGMRIARNSTALSSSSIPLCAARILASPSIITKRHISGNSQWGGQTSLLGPSSPSSSSSSYFQRPSLPANTIIRFVPQQTAWIVERMGKFNRILEPGLAILIPFLDRIAYVKSLKEAAMEIPSQNAITADNVTLELDGVLYTRVFDAYKAR